MSLWPSQMYVIYTLRDLNVMGLQILMAWVIKWSHVYETTPNSCEISLSNVSPGNKGCRSIWHVDLERSQLGILPRLAACVHFLRKPQSLISCTTMPAVKSALLWQYMVVIILLKAHTFEMNNFLAIPGHGFWGQKGEHLPNCFA